jgi:hypothetical protein
MRIRNRTTLQGSDQQIIEGIRGDLLGMTTLYLGGRTFTPQTLEQFIQIRIDAASAIAEARAAWLKTIADYEGIDADTRIVVRDLQRLVVGAFGDQSPKLAHFGFTPEKKPAWSEETKAAAVVKRAATRAARSTRGPRARLAIKGATSTSHAAPSFDTETATQTAAQTATKPTTATPTKGDT